MGAKRLSNLCQLLDQRCKEGDLLLVQETLREIEQHVPMLLDEVAKILSEKAE